MRVYRWIGGGDAGVFAADIVMPIRVMYYSGMCVMTSGMSVQVLWLNAVVLLDMCVVVFGLGVWRRWCCRLCILVYEL